MLLYVFMGLLLTTFGFMCFFARDTLWRMSVPDSAPRKPDRRKWDRVMMIFGAVSVICGLWLAYSALAL